MKDKNLNIEALKNTFIVLGLLFFFGGGAWFLLSSSEYAQNSYRYYFFALMFMTIGYKAGNSEPYSRRTLSTKELKTSRQIRDRACFFLVIIFIIILQIKEYF